MAATANSNQINSGKVRQEECSTSQMFMEGYKRRVEKKERDGVIWWLEK